MVLIKCDTPSEFHWPKRVRHYWQPRDERMKHLEEIRCGANAASPYGFEYNTAVGGQLVKTALHDRSYLTLTQALRVRLEQLLFAVLRNITK